MYCKECGKEIDNDSKFCSYCGTKQSFNQTSQNNIDSNHESNPISKIINVAKSFEKTDYAKKEMSKIDKYDRNYKGDSNATIAGIVVLILNSTLLIVARESTDNFFMVFFWVFLTIWRITAIFFAVNIAKRQNRQTTTWGIFALFLPYPTIIILGLLKKLDKPSSKPSEFNSNLQEFNVNSPQNLELAKLPDNSNLDTLKFSVRKVNTTNSFFWNRNEYTIDFFDNKTGKIYSYDSKLFFIIRDIEPTQVYYRSKESAVKALYNYLCKSEIIMDNFVFYKDS